MGEFELILGCMYAGKTEELLRRLGRYMHAERRIQLFKPVIDQRYSKLEVVSHDGRRMESIPVESASDLASRLEDPEIIGIDELQFFDEKIIDFCRDQLKQNRTIIASALQTDFRGEPFSFRGSEKHLGYLMPHAHVTQLYAVCKYRDASGRPCGTEAEMTQRLIDGKPASRDSPIVLVGGAEAYEARCRKHHICL